MLGGIRQHGNKLIVVLLVVLAGVLAVQTLSIPSPETPTEQTGGTDPTPEKTAGTDTPAPRTTESSETDQPDRKSPPETTTPQSGDEVTRRVGPPAGIPDLPSSPPSPAFRTTFEEGSLSAWTVSGNGPDTGGVRLIDGTLRLHVEQCYTVTARRTVGRYNGTIRLGFEWLSTAEQWYERPDWRLLAPDGSTYNYTVVRGGDLARPDKASTRKNVTVVTAAVDGPVTVEFRIDPSRYCGRANHGITVLYIDELFVKQTG